MPEPKLKTMPRFETEAEERAAQERRQRKRETRPERGTLRLNRVLHHPSRHPCRVAPHGRASLAHRRRRTVLSG